METIRLFDAEPYMTSAESNILSCEKIEKEGRTVYAVVLDKTIFFPEEGGQSPDSGTINGIRVVDVQVQDRVITHYLEEAVHGEKAEMCLDWEHRFSNMQQHSGEHIFSGLVHSMYGFENVGFHLSDNSVTMDFNGVLSAEDVAKIENKVNEAIYKNIKIEAGYVDSEALKTLVYRSKKELAGPVRIVTIPGYDSCACCAPHVERTGEIGMLKVIHLQNYKGGVRIHILCGQRALLYYRESLALIDSLQDYLTTGRENLLENVQKLKTETLSLSSKLLNAKQELLNNELSAIPIEQENVILFKEKIDNVIIRNAVNALVSKHKGVIAFFSGDDEKGYSYILASAECDVREAQKKLGAELGAKGGGKPQMVQGSVAATEEKIRALFM